MRKAKRSRKLEIITEDDERKGAERTWYNKREGGERERERESYLTGFESSRRYIKSSRTRFRLNFFE